MRSAQVINCISTGGAFGGPRRHHRKATSLITKPIKIANDNWATSRCMLLGGTALERSVPVRTMSFVPGSFDTNTVIEGNLDVMLGTHVPPPPAGYDTRVS